MKSLKQIIGIAAIGIVTSPLMANPFVGGDTEAEALKSEADLKYEVFERLSEINDGDLKIDEATITVSFYVNSDGDVAIESVESNNYQAKLAAIKLLQGRKMYVTTDLQNKRHTVSVSFN